MSKRTQIARQVDEVCKQLRRLVADLALHYPDDVKMERVRSRVGIAVSTLPNKVVENLHEYLTRYRTFVYAENDEDLFGDLFIVALSKEPELEGKSEESTLALYAINRLLDTAAKMHPTVRADYRTRIRALAESCALYTLLTTR